MRQSKGVTKHASAARAGGDLSTRCEAARNLEASPTTLALLATDVDISVRLLVAKNPRTPPRVLMVLADDKTWEVRRGIAENARTPTHSLAQLAVTKGVDVDTLPARMLEEQDPKLRAALRTAIARREKE